MENKYFLINGKEVELNVSDMAKISEYYHLQNIADYVRENTTAYAEIDIQEISQEVIHKMDKNIQLSEEEAITLAISDFEKKRGKEILAQ